MRASFDINNFLNTLNAINGVTIPENYNTNLNRIAALVEIHENENPYEPFKNYEGGKKVIKDSSYPMPNLK